MYSFLKLIGDLGGVLEILVLLFVYFMTPITSYSFNMQAMENLYLARSKDASLFLPRTPQNTNKMPLPDSLNNTEPALSCQNDYPIRLNLKNHLLTFLATHWCSCL